VSAPAAVKTVYVETTARLHFSVLDLAGTLGRWFGGIGAAAPGPTLRLSACPSAVLTASGHDAERAELFARRFLDHHGVAAGSAIRIASSLPAHAGLGSGTQLGLAVGRALAELHGVSADVRSLARAVGRAERSAIGTWIFDRGGFVLEGGHPPNSGAVSPLLARVPMPQSWRCVVAVPRASQWMTGSTEAAAFARLPAPPEREAERVAHLVLMALLPALADADLTAFGAALRAIQEMTGRWFAPIQGGIFAPGPTEELVHRLTEWGGHGVGQSSWGPAVYAIVEGDEAGARLADRARTLLSDGGNVYCGPFRNEGARIWRETV